MLKLFTKAHETPAMPKRNNEGVNILFLPKWSARTPKTGDKNMPGKVKKVIRSETVFVGISSSSDIFGKAGAIEVIPITAMSVTPKIT